MMTANHRTEFKREFADSLEKEIAAFQHAHKSPIDRMNNGNPISTRMGVPLRVERQRISRVATHEAVVNAIVHKDHSNGSTPQIVFSRSVWKSSNTPAPSFPATNLDAYSGDGFDISTGEMRHVAKTTPKRK